MHLARSSCDFGKRPKGDGLCPYDDRNARNLMGRGSALTQHVTAVKWHSRPLLCQMNSLYIHYLSFIITIVIVVLLSLFCDARVSSLFLSLLRWKGGKFYCNYDEKREKKVRKKYQRQRWALYKFFNHRSNSDVQLVKFSAIAIDRTI